MNIWSLAKHKTLKLLLFKLENQLGKENIRLEEELVKEFFAITLVNKEHPELRAYVYIYGQAKNLYGLHLEYPYDSDYEYSHHNRFHEDLSLKQVVKILASHFDVTNYEMAI